MSKVSRWRDLLGLILILAGAAIAIASLYPRLQIPGFGENSDFVFRVVAYGALVILSGMLWCRLRWVAVAVLVFSTLVEGLQYFVPERQVYLSDLAANVVVVFAGLAIIALWRCQQDVHKPDDKVR